MKKYDNFCNTLVNMADIFKYSEPYDNVTLTGLVGVFEICFEQAWKAMKEILSEHGYDSSQTGSPKKVLQTAFSSGMIDDEELWLKALLARNNVVHAYDRNIAAEIGRQAKDDYYDMFCRLKDKLENEWV